MLYYTHTIDKSETYPKQERPGFIRFRVRFSRYLRHGRRRFGTGPAKQ